MLDKLLAERSLWRDVLEQLLVVDLPAQTAADAPGHAAAPRARFAADGNGQRERNRGYRHRRPAVALKAMMWRVQRRVHFTPPSHIPCARTRSCPVPVARPSRLAKPSPPCRR